MRIEEYIELQERVFSSCVELSRSKGHDYSGTEDTLLNLKASRILGMDPRMGVLLRMQDKIMRLKKFIETSTLKNESVEDSIKDIINYATLYLALTEEGKKKLQPDIIEQLKKPGESLEEARQRLISGANPIIRALNEAGVSAEEFWTYSPLLLMSFAPDDVSAFSSLLRRLADVLEGKEKNVSIA